MCERAFIAERPFLPCISGIAVANGGKPVEGTLHDPFVIDGQGLIMNAHDIAYFRASGFEQADALEGRIANAPAVAVKIWVEHHDYAHIFGSGRADGVRDFVRANRRLAYIGGDDQDTLHRVCKCVM